MLTAHSELLGEVDAILVGVMFASLVLAVLTGPRRYMNGRHVSRPLARRFGRGRVVVARGLMCWGWLLDYHLWTVLLVALTAANIDDWLTGDDEDRESRLAGNLRRWAGALRPVGYSTTTAPSPA